MSWNDFNVGGGALFVRFSTDNGLTWNNQRQITTGVPFVRNVQITGDLATGEVYLAGIDEGGGGFPHNNVNKIFRSTDGGNTWTNTYSGPTSSGPGRGVSGYFACMYNNPLTGVMKAGVSRRPLTMSSTMSMTRGMPVAATPAMSSTFVPRMAASPSARRSS